MEWGRKGGRPQGTTRGAKYGAKEQLASKPPDSMKTFSTDERKGLGWPRFLVSVEAHVTMATRFMPAFPTAVWTAFIDLPDHVCDDLATHSRVGAERQRGRSRSATLSPSPQARLRPSLLRLRRNRARPVLIRIVRLRRFLMRSRIQVRPIASDGPTMMHSRRVAASGGPQVKFDLGFGCGITSRAVKSAG